MDLSDRFQRYRTVRILNQGSTFPYDDANVPSGTLCRSIEPRDSRRICAACAMVARWLGHHRCIACRIHNTLDRPSLCGTQFLSRKPFPSSILRGGSALDKWWRSNRSYRSHQSHWRQRDRTQVAHDRALHGYEEEIANHQRKAAFRRAVLRIANHQRKVVASQNHVHQKQKEWVSSQTHVHQ